MYLFSKLPPITHYEEKNSSGRCPSQGKGAIFYKSFVGMMVAATVSLGESRNVVSSMRYALDFDIPMLDSARLLLLLVTRSWRLFHQRSL